MRTYFVIPNFWQKSPTNLSGFAKWNSEKAGYSFSRPWTFFLISLLVLLIKFPDCFTTSCCTFFNFLQKQGKGVVYVLIRAFLLFKNLKNIVKQCVSYPNFTIFLNIWKTLILNHRIWKFLSLFTYFSAIMLKATQKIDQSTCCKYMGD